MVLLLAVDDLDVDGGEVFRVADGGRPVGRAQQQQPLERDVLAVVDDVALDAAVRIVDQPLFRPRLAVAGVGREVVPQPRVALHVDGAAPRQAGILHVVEDHHRAQRPSPGGHRRRDVVRALARPANQRACVHIELHVALHHDFAGEVDSSGEKQHAAAGPRGDVGDGPVDGRRLQRLARVVHLVVHDVDHVGVAQLRRVLLLRLGKEKQAWTLEGGLFVEEDHQIARLVEVEADRLAADLRMNSIRGRPDVAGDHVALVDQRGDRHMHLAGHREAGVVHPLKLVVGGQAMHKDRLAVHRHAVGQALRRAGIRRVWCNRGERSAHGSIENNKNIANNTTGPDIPLNLIRFFSSNPAFLSLHSPRLRPQPRLTAAAPPAGLPSVRSQSQSPIRSTVPP